jgi:serine/threonine protein kinase
MPQTDHQKVAAVFDQAMAVVDGPARDKLLDQRCGDDRVLRLRVETLLQAYTQGGYLERFADGIRLIDFEQPSPSLVGERIADYELLELLGTGGMADVYLARAVRDAHESSNGASTQATKSQPSSLNDKELVAVKLIQDRVESAQVLSRFEREQHLLEQMNHSGIAKFIAAGVGDQGRAYMVMEFIRGTTITEYCDRVGLSINDRLQLMIQVCDAVEYAHSQDVIHRDLKPGNILIEQHQGQSNVKIIDFGIAKAFGSLNVGSSSLTHTEKRMGTPAYMSPEQFAWGSDVSAESDVYSLGAILCELLVGTTPLVKALDIESDGYANYGLEDRILQQTVLHREPLRPSQILASLPADEAIRIALQRRIETSHLKQRLHADLDWVVAKAMALERSSRYRSAMPVSYTHLTLPTKA